MRHCFTTREKVLAAIIATTPVAFLISVPWLKDLSETVTFAITAAAAIIVMGGAMLLSVRVEGRLDEVQRAGSRFASHWGMTVGGSLAVLVAMLPPLQSQLAALIGRVNDAPTDTDGATLVFTLGIVTAVAMQAVATGVLGRAWRRHMTRAQ